MKWATIAFLLISGSAFAQSTKFSEKEVTAWNSVQYELTQCAAVWQFLTACAPEGAKVEETKRVARHFSELAVAVGTEIGMTQDAMNSRLKIVMEDQAKLIEGKCINFSSLAIRYLDRCKGLGEHPEAAFREYMNK
ncbi:MAG: hypothetical protein ACRECV_18190 [Xanthobacteraceae bacterium]